MKFVKVYSCNCSCYCSKYSSTLIILSTTDPLPQAGREYPQKLSMIKHNLLYVLSLATHMHRQDTAVLNTVHVAVARILLKPSTVHTMVWPSVSPPRSHYRLPLWSKWA